MLVDMQDLATTLDVATMDNIAQAIGAKMRETDIIGWYQNSTVLGVILTTLNGASRRTLENVVVARTRGVLALTTGCRPHPARLDLVPYFPG
jgi:hypothetical protein